MFWWRLGFIGLIDPDEPFYAETAREMVETGDWLTPHIFGQPQFEKPILYYWLVAASFEGFGITEFAGRLPTAVFATLIVLMTYAFGARIFNRRAGSSARWCLRPASSSRSCRGSCSRTFRSRHYCSET